MAYIFAYVIFFVYLCTLFEKYDNYGQYERKTDNH